MERRAGSERDTALFRTVARVVDEQGLELVDVALRGAGGRRVLRVDIDRPGPVGVGLDDCQRVSRALGDVLDDTDPIGTRYVLEVSSPGADRPLRSAEDFRRNTGRRIVVTANDPEGCPRSFRGRLLGCEQDCILLAGDGDDAIRIPLAGIVKAQQELPL